MRFEPRTITLEAANNNQPLAGGSYELGVVHGMMQVHKHLLECADDKIYGRMNGCEFAAWFSAMLASCVKIHLEGENETQ